MKKMSALLLILVAVSMTACGNSGPSTTINITMTDFQFSPNEFTVPAGAEITVDATHSGAVVHDFIIMKYGTITGEKFDEEDKANIYWEMKLQPNITETATFIAPAQPGEYQIICGIPGHLQAGMIGKLIVVHQE